ncbi:hypothetical protein DFH07DRAFT_1062527 [Mycena maculata]|uniref:Uncharacterized protein n=1 Tax=Mycena maculata TaxID=230809 RepID=A0AAD7N754_9AGAR|nr:hypothetical protein DFH07DRAFT_1062527 [Mycena maculata]
MYTDGLFGADPLRASGVNAAAPRTYNTSIGMRVEGSIELEAKGNALLLTTNTEDASIAGPAISPQVLRFLPPHLFSIPFPKVLAYVSPAAFLLLHPNASEDDELYHKTLLKRLPIDPSAPPPAGPPPPPPRALKPGTADVDANAGPSESAEFHARRVAGSPASHVVLVTIPGIAKEWDLMRLLRPSETAQIRTAQTETSEPPPVPAPKFLAGVEDLFTHCSQICFRKFAMHASANPDLPRPDLIDSALLCPGRLDKALFCDMPSLADRADHEITVAHLSEVLKTMRPSVSAEERMRLDRIYRGFV